MLNSSEAENVHKMSLLKNDQWVLKQVKSYFFSIVYKWAVKISYSVEHDLFLYNLVAGFDGVTVILFWMFLNSFLFNQPSLHELYINVICTI